VSADRPIPAVVHEAPAKAGAFLRSLVTAAPEWHAGWRQTFKSILQKSRTSRTACRAEFVSDPIFSLSQATGEAGRYAIDSVAPLEPMLGPEATEAFRVGLIAHSKAWKPWLRSARKNGELNQIRALDSMGVAGVTLDAKSRSDWADRLDSLQARRAAGYATLELNGFPDWLTTLARAKPDDVRAVLSQEIAIELGRPVDGPRFGVLQDIARGHSHIAELMAPFVLEELERRPTLAAAFLSPALNIVKRGAAAERDRLKALTLERFSTATVPAIGSLYIAAAFALDGGAATSALLVKLNTLTEGEQVALVQRVLPHVFGEDSSLDGTMLQHLPFDSLERLVRLAYQMIRIEDDNKHSGVMAYSPDSRDHAESARSEAFGRLVNAPGRAAFDAIQRLGQVRDFPVSKARLHDLAVERAAKDSEAAEWKPGEALAFERSAETEPQTPRDLQLVALRRLTDMQHDLHHDDFQQGETLANLPSERAVQNWTADRMRLKQGRSYSVEREVHVAGEKEPDIRLRAKATDASVPIEIKVAESWTLEDLEKALKIQLCGQYLRARDSRHGILLLVHQKARPQGWRNARDGTVLTFSDVVKHLRAMAVALSGRALDAPQPEIAVVDVSSFRSEEGATPSKAIAKRPAQKGGKSKKAKVSGRKGAAPKRNS
jgi:hypothetical protein